MIRQLQMVDWGLAPPYPVPVHERVTVFTGVNGSGKSSAMDGVKALLGVRQFGQRRTPASYINNGRGVHPPAQTAYIIAACELPPSSGLPFADSDGRFTLMMATSRSRERFLALPGTQLLDEPVADSLDALLDTHPMSAWMTKEAYNKRVLDPIGANRAVRKILEIPQGETQRMLDVRPDELLRNLLALMGELEPLHDLRERRAQTEAARAERDAAKAALRDEELVLTRLERDLAGDRRLQAAQDALHATISRARGAARALLDTTTSEHASLLDERAELEGRKQTLGAQLQDATQAAEIARAAPGVYEQARKDAARLSEHGIDARVLLEALPADADRNLLAIIGGWVCAIQIRSQDAPAATALLGTGTPFILADTPAAAIDALRTAYPGSEQDGMVAAPGGLLIPPSDLSLPVDPDAPARLAGLRSEIRDLERALDRIEDRARGLLSERERAQAAIAALGDGEILPAEPQELAGLLAEHRRAQALVAEEEAREASNTKKAQQLTLARARLTEAETYLEAQQQALDAAQDVLRSARDAYNAHVSSLMGRLSGEFSRLCQDALMGGELRFTADPMTEAGGRLEVLVADNPTADVRPLAESDLSGGWKAKTSVLLLMAAICAASGQATLPLVCLDEHSAQLDQDRITELGEVFQRISRIRGLQFICAMPSKQSTEAPTWCDLQIAFLKAPPQERYSPLPHLLAAHDHVPLGAV